MRLLFLLENSAILDILAQNSTKYKIHKHSKFYIYFNPDIFYSKIDEDYYFTHIYNDSSSKIASNQQEFQSAKKKDKIGFLIKNDRIIFDFDETQYFLDIFYKELNSLVILSAEFLDDKSANDFVLPEFLRLFIQKEITNLKEYSDKFLALYGLPSFDFDIKKAVGIYDKNPNLVVKLPAYLETNQAFLFILNLLFEKIKVLRNVFLKTKDKNDLHKIRVLLRKIRTILKFSNFDKDKIDVLKLVTKNIADMTNKKREMDIFLDFLKEQNAIVEFSQYIEKYNDNLTNKLVMFFESDEFELFLQKFSEFLNFDFGKSGSIIKDYSAKIILKQIKIIKMALKELDENSPNEVFHKIRIEFKKLRYVLEYFSILFNDKKLQKIAKKSKKMQNLFGKLQDNDSHQKIIAMFQNSNLKNEIILEFLSNLNLKIVALNNECKRLILLDKKNIVKIINKNIKFLKIYKEI